MNRTPQRPLCRLRRSCSGLRALASGLLLVVLVSSIIAVCGITTAAHPRSMPEWQLCEWRNMRRASVEAFRADATTLVDACALKGNIGRYIVIELRQDSRI